MPPRHTGRKVEDSDRRYVTRISLTEDVMDAPDSRHVPYYSSSDCSDSGYYQEIPVEVYLKPKTLKKNHSQKPRVVVSRAESPEPETKLYVYIPEEVSLDGSLSDDSAIVHHVHSGYRQDQLPQPQQIRLVQKKPSTEAPPGYKMVPASYVQKRPKESPGKTTSVKGSPVKVNPVKARIQAKARRSPQYREVPSYEDFSEQHSSERPVYPQQSSPVQFRQARHPSQASAVKKPQPVRPMPQQVRPMPQQVRPMPKHGQARNPPPQLNGGFRQAHVQKKPSRPEPMSIPVQHNKNRTPNIKNVSMVKAFKSVPIQSVNVKKSRPQMSMHSGGGWGPDDSGRGFSHSGWGRSNAGRDFGDSSRGPTGARSGGRKGSSNAERGRNVEGRGRKMVPVRKVQDPYPCINYLDQDYNTILQKYQARGKLFVDREFPADNESLGDEIASYRRIVWKRPYEICDNPKFLVGGASRFDVKQGELGDCWLLAAIASLTCSQKLLHKVVPPEQNFEDGYTGIFKFKIWHQGEWIEVVVDDRLPTYNDQLVFMHSAEENEFWSALLEKAYAKLNGSYEALKGGSTSEAMEDFTGGVTEMFDLREAPANMFQIMKKAYERSALMGCSIDADPNQLEAELDNGLVMGHAYSVTAVKFVEVQTPRISGQIPLIRVRNPWGNKVEWQGAWSDSSREWQLISEDEKADLGLTFDNDGEFWMSYQDFSGNFQKLEICNLGPDDHTDEDDEGEERKRWAATCENGSWTPRVSAGGCRNYLETFWTNPQYRVTLTDPDEDDEDEECTMIVGLLQKDRRKKRKEGLDMLTIGYCIYKTDDDQPQNLDMNFFKYNASVAKSPSFINLREVCGRHKLPPGNYCIVPSTFAPHENGDFLLRIFSEHKNTTSQVDEETGYQQQPDPEPTSEEEEQENSLRQYFRQLAGEDMEIDAFELQEVLNTVFQQAFEFSFPGFTIDTCRSMVAMHDGDMSGKLGYDEFKSLWTDLRRWKTVFKQFDKDCSGNLSSYELRSAFRHVGFTLSNNTLSALVMRYSKRDGNIDFGDFVSCAVRLKTMINTFKSLEVQGSGRAFFTMDDFIQTTMYS